MGEGGEEERERGEEEKGKGGRKIEEKRSERERGGKRDLAPPPQKKKSWRRHCDDWYTNGHFLPFDCFWRLVHCWYSLGRPVTIGTPMVIFAVLTVF